MDIFTPDIPVWEIAARSLIVFGFLLLLIRFSGKRDVGEMSPADLILLLLLSANVHTSLSGDDKSIVGGLIGAAVLMGTNFLLNHFAFNNKKFEKLLKGAPELIIYKGDLRVDILKRHKLTKSQVKVALRKEGVLRIEDTDLAVLEPDGTISVIDLKKQKS